MALQKQVIGIEFGDLDQGRGKKHFLTVLGKLTIAENTRWRKTKQYGKRDGFTRLDRNIDTGTLLTGKDLASTGDELVLRTEDTVYMRSTAQTRWLNIGGYQPVVADNKVALMAPSSSGANRGLSRPQVVREGGRVWVFATTITSPAGTHYTVYDEATGAEIVPQTRFTATGYYFLKAVEEGGSVWLFAGPATVGGLTLTLFKFATASPGTGPTSTTYYTASAGTPFGWDILDAGANGILVGVVGANTLNLGSGAGVFHLSKLSTSTGLPAAGWAVSSGGLSSGDAPCAWVENTNGNTAYFAFRNTSGGASILADVTVSASAGTITSINNSGVASSLPAKGFIGGWWDGFDRNYLITDATSVENAFTVRRKFDGAALTGVLFTQRAMYLASDPFLVGSTWFAVFGHDDDTDLQRAYYVMQVQTWRKVGRWGYERGGIIGGRNGAFATGTDRIDFQSTVQPYVNGTTVTMALQHKLFAGGSDLVISSVAFDFDPDVSPPASVMDGQLIVYPGSWPMALAGEARLSELAPMMYPRTAGGSTAAGAVPAGTYGFALVYAQVDRNGNIYRSAPSPTQSLVSGGANSFVFAMPTLRVHNSTVNVFLELYMTTAGGATLQLHSVYANDSTVDSVAATVTAVPATNAEIIYTDGGVLKNAAPPACRWVATFKNRIVVGGTEFEGDNWMSQELSTGFGPQFNASIRYITREGLGHTRMAGQVDRDYFATFKRDAVFVVSGDGPSRQGRGNYVPGRISGAMGCDNPRSVVSAPPGCFYQGTDGGIYLIPEGVLKSVYIGDGVDDHKSATVTGACHVIDEELVIFTLDTGVALVFDYGHPLPEEGSLGRWYTWTGMGTATAAVSHAGAFCFLKSDGIVEQQTAGLWSDNNGASAINQKLKTAPIQIAGIRGVGMVYRAQFEGERMGTHTIRFVYDTDYGTAQGGTSETFSLASAGPDHTFEFRPSANMKPTAVEVTIDENGGTVGSEGFRMDALALEVGIKPGLRRPKTAQRIG